MGPFIDRASSASRQHYIDTGSYLDSEGNVPHRGHSDAAHVPTTVHRGNAHVVAAVFVPGGLGGLDSHVVIYPDDYGNFTVHYLVQDDDGQRTYLHQGSYDLTYREALAELGRRIQHVS